MVDCPFFSILKTMTGFKTLSLEFVIPVMPIPRHAQSENTPTSLRNEQYKTDTAYNMRLLKNQLEPALGPATSEILPNPDDQNLVGYLVFHPR